MEDLTFTLKDLIEITGIVITVLIYYFKQNSNLKSYVSEIRKDLNTELAEIKTSLQKELDTKTKELNDLDTQIAVLKKSQETDDSHFTEIKSNTEKLFKILNQINLGVTKDISEHNMRLKALEDKANRA